jgi:threonine/homoserine/homoserine lactone efflux protein
MEIFLVKGFVIGFSIAAPVGPIGLLCISRSLSFGRLSGLATGLGAAAADGVYGAIAAFGLAFVTDLMIGHQSSLTWIGGLFLLGMGIRTFFRSVPDSNFLAAERNLSADFASTFVLTLTNPFTILAFTAIFAGMGVSGAPSEYRAAGALVAGVFFGSAAWWMLLSFGVSLIHRRISPVVMRAVNRLSGVTLAGLGLLALLY